MTAESPDYVLYALFLKAKIYKDKKFRRKYDSFVGGKVLYLIGHCP